MTDPVFEGAYGTFTITDQDRREVLSYRLALLTVAVAESALLLQWTTRGPQGLWPWLLLMVAGLGLALRWIHIYLKPLHRTLQLFWLLGSIGGLVLAWRHGADGVLGALAADGRWIWAVGPFFAALAGVGFKEFFCFRRPEAIGVTLLLPLALLGRLTGLLGDQATVSLLALQAALLLLLTLRKFPMEAAADVGDKSVFAYLEQQRPTSIA
ncbi:DUF2301 domain-containing membrane protein [Cyanobium sp. Morenito 9A2]|uniref:DUF2301 domain-containing membrane protein n=1 Tax=Cyanobium sp. Morenito 9A2 TaxID=2823718 RepID=UPI0020CC0E7A|nr:DUF2301 domain-containing membrane protein [Cyanobium sp. Morenito 9A2]MCP9850866.1 hypothetical protein [Cyanobium sp. Morenito 9A2]